MVIISNLADENLRRPQDARVREQLAATRRREEVIERAKRRDLDFMAWQAEQQTRSGHRDRYLLSAQQELQKEIAVAISAMPEEERPGFYGVVVEDETEDSELREQLRTVMDPVPAMPEAGMFSWAGREGEQCARAPAGPRLGSGRVGSGRGAATHEPGHGGRAGSPPQLPRPRHTGARAGSPSPGASTSWNEGRMRMEEEEASGASRGGGRGGLVFRGQSLLGQRRGSSGALRPGGSGVVRPGASQGNLGSSSRGFSSTRKLGRARKAEREMFMDTRSAPFKGLGRSEIEEKMERLRVKGETNFYIGPGKQEYPNNLNFPERFQMKAHPADAGELMGGGRSPKRAKSPEPAREVADMFMSTETGMSANLVAGVLKNSFVAKKERRLEIQQSQAKKRVPRAHAGDRVRVLLMHAEADLVALGRELEGGRPRDAPSVPQAIRPGPPGGMGTSGVGAGRWVVAVDADGGHKFAAAEAGPLGAQIGDRVSRMLRALDRHCKASVLTAAAVEKYLHGMEADRRRLLLSAVGAFYSPEFAAALAADVQVTQDRIRAQVAEQARKKREEDEHRALESLKIYHALRRQSNSEADLDDDDDPETADWAKKSGSKRRGNTAASKTKAPLEYASSCFLPTSWVSLPLLRVIKVNHNTALFEFEIPDQRSLDLPVSACVLACLPRGEPDGSDAIRPYTPVSHPYMQGAFQVAVKVYREVGQPGDIYYKPAGVLSTAFHSLKPGDKMLFKHIKVNIKYQYPFTGVETITMVNTGIGVTPMIQALHKLLYTTGEKTRVVMLYGVRTVADIFMRKQLEEWEQEFSERLKVVFVVGGHSLLAEMKKKKGKGEPVPMPEGYEGLKNKEVGWVNEKCVKKHGFPPSPTTRVFVCGVPGFYDSMCGPRTEPGVRPGTTLDKLGYGRESVVKL